MSLFPFYRYPFFNDPFFFNEFDFFDPWYDFVLFPSLVPITPQYRWFKHKERLTYSSTNVTNNSKSLEQTSPPPQTEKFRVQLDVDGFNPDAIKKRIEGRKLIVEGEEKDCQQERTYTSRKMRETYELPEHADPNGLTSHVAPNNKLVIEVPFKKFQTERRLEQAKNNNRNLAPFGQCCSSSFSDGESLNDSSLQPRIVNKGNNQKQLEITVDVKNYRPQDLQVSVKNAELIVQGEHQHKDENRSERSSFFKSTTLPHGTQIDQLESRLDDNGQLKIQAPVL